MLISSTHGKVRGRGRRGDFGRILAEVYAASLNPADSAIRSGYMHQMMPLTFPAVPGIDIAGVVAGTDPGVSAL
jgi:NADPH:quinone reductase-like Zn-dependent oxidoreductase